VRYWLAYDLDDICALYSDLGLHPQTIRKWTKLGLKTIDAGKPALIYGYDLIQHLKRNNTSNKCQTAFDEMFCMGCQDARRILKNQISVNQKTQFLQVQGICRQCKSRMFKSYKLIDIASLQLKFKLVGVLELYDDPTPTDKTHIQAHDEKPLSESLQGELF